MKIAVTGANGFVGRYVINELNDRGIDTVACTRSLNSVPKSGSAIRWLEQDLDHATEQFFEKLGHPDALIHLARPGLPHYNSLHHFERALPSQYRFLAGLVKAGLKSLVVTGTCFEYGMQSGPLSASSETKPENPYAFAKDALRKQLEFLQTEYDFNLAWGRLFYVYGDGQSEASLFPSLKQAVNRGDRCFKMSSGEQIRDFLPIGEASQILVDMAVNSNSSRVSNICSGQPTTVRAQVERWIAEYGWNIELDLGHYSCPSYEPLAFWGVPDREH